MHFLREGRDNLRRLGAFASISRLDHPGVERSAQSQQSLAVLWTRRLQQASDLMRISLGVVQFLAWSAPFHQVQWRTRELSRRMQFAHQWHNWEALFLVAIQRRERRPFGEVA